MIQLRHNGRVLHAEELPDDFPVYRSQEDRRWIVVRSDSVPAKDTETRCCAARPVKYFPDWPNKKRWWLLCPGCKGAIKANGDVA